jgi:hypothetical protein
MNKTCPRPERRLGHDRGTDRNRRASVSLSPTLALFLAPHGKLYLRLQERVPESEGGRLTASTPQRQGHLQSKYQVLSFKSPIFRTDILSSQYKAR